MNIMRDTRCILLVDDNENDVQLAMLALDERPGQHRITVARDGAEALDYLYGRGSFAASPRETPDFILLDLKMPRVDGFEVLRQIRSDERLRTIPVVMFTSSREENDVNQSYRLGVNAYVVKPVQFQQYLDAVRETEAFWGTRNEPPPTVTGRSAAA